MKNAQDILKLKLKGEKMFKGKKIKLSEVIFYFWLALWLLLGVFVLSQLENKEILLTWAVTSAIMVLGMLILDIKNREDKGELK